MFNLRLVLVLLMFVSCNQKKYPSDPALEHALELAGENRPELEKVLANYELKGSLEYKAAVFLIKWMPGKYGKVFADYDQVIPVFNALAQYKPVGGNGKQREYFHDYLRSVIRTRYGKILSGHFQYKTENDLETITSSYLIENIDYAFKAWRLPWARGVSFEDFCEYILPYRYGTEPLSAWRRQCWEENRSLIDSLRNEKDLVKVGDYLNEKHRQTFSELSDLKKLSNSIKSNDLLRINTSSSCIDQTGLGLLVMRVMGVPAGRLIIPLWGNKSSGHDFLGILSAHKWLYFNFAESAPGKTRVSSIFTTAKMYAETFSLNKTDGFPADIRSGSQYFGHQDVTRAITDVGNVYLRSKQVNKNITAYICVFNNTAWIPVMKSFLNKGKLEFQDMGRNVLYNVAIEENKKLKFTGNPFIINNRGVAQEIVPVQEKISLKMNRKFPVNAPHVRAASRLEGGVFEGSNDSSFKDASVLWKLDGLAFLNHNERQLTNTMCQYVRFKFPVLDTLNEGLAGIQFFTAENQQKIPIKGTPISSSTANAIFYKAVFDNDPLTYVKIFSMKFADFDQYSQNKALVVPADDRFWVGLKFEKFTAINTISISSRTDDNSINPTETYELFYWENRWKSLGRKVAVTNNITFEVAINGLFLLKNVNKGKENRPFLYKNGYISWL